jgi:transposase-like protein
MSRRRALSDEQCQALAEWFDTPRTVRAKARELGISESALYDSVARAKRESAPRETPDSEALSYNGEHLLG